MYMFGAGNYAIDSWTVFTIISCGTFFPSGGNNVRFCDPELDAKMAEANATADEAQREKLYGEAAKLDNERVPYLWLYSPGGLWAVNEKVRGFTPLSPTGGGFWQPENWRI